MNNYVKFFSKLMGVLSHFRKLFNDGLQFGFSPGNIRNLGFIKILRTLNFKGDFNRFRREGHRGSFRGKGKLDKRIEMRAWRGLQRRWGNAEKIEKDGTKGGA